MEQFEREQAHPLTIDDIRKIADEEIVKDSNPCLKKLVYIETRETEKQSRRIFPAYPFSVTEGRDGDVLILFIVQYAMKTYQTVGTAIPMSDVGVTCRFWNLPPKESVMDRDPLPKKGVQ